MSFWPNQSHEFGMWQLPHFGRQRLWTSQWFKCQFLTGFVQWRALDSKHLWHYKRIALIHLILKLKWENNSRWLMKKFNIISLLCFLHKITDCVVVCVETKFPTLFGPLQPAAWSSKLMWRYHRHFFSDPSIRSLTLFDCDLISFSVWHEYIFLWAENEGISKNICQTMKDYYHL